MVDPEALENGAAGDKGVLWSYRALCMNAAGSRTSGGVSVGTDEVNLDRNHISWASPLGRALMRSGRRPMKCSSSACAGVELETLTVLEVLYERISVEPFHVRSGPESLDKGLDPALTLNERSYRLLSIGRKKGEC